MSESVVLKSFITTAFLVCGDFAAIFNDFGRPTAFGEAFSVEVCFLWSRFATKLLWNVEWFIEKLPGYFGLVGVSWLYAVRSVLFLRFDDIGDTMGDFGPCFFNWLKATERSCLVLSASKRFGF